MRPHRLLRPMLFALALLLISPMVVALPPAQAQSTDAAPLAEPFASYYWRYQGPRVLGAVNTPAQEIDGYQMQYFEKGRLEDHRHETGFAALTHSPLTRMLMDSAPDYPINGLPITYGELAARGAEQHAPPAGFGGGTLWQGDQVFIPADPALGVAPGYLVPFQFWTYINRASLFPGGWQNDIGLPLTPAFHLEVADAAGTLRPLVVQGFERAVLTLDMANVYGWSVERLNIGTDALWAFGQQPLFAQPTPPAARPLAGPQRIEVDLEGQWLYAYAGDELVLDAPVSTGKDGFNTPRGTFGIYSKVPLKRLRGHGGGESWDVPDVPHIMFYQGGVAIHGVYWHDRFGTGERHSHGCVGLAPEDARLLFAWAPYGTPVRVR